MFIFYIFVIISIKIFFYYLNIILSITLASFNNKKRHFLDNTVYGRGREGRLISLGR